MLDMLLPADAARKHGHEHSAPHHHHSLHLHHHNNPDPSSPGQSHTANGSFLVQMPLTFVGSFLRRSTTPSPAPPAATSTTTTTTTSDETAANSPKQESNAAHDPSLDASALPRPQSSGSSAAADDKPKKRTPRSKTSYIYAHPPRPVDPRSKLHLRPKVLLQLHKVVPSQRPKPTYEVIHFSLLHPRSTRRLARAFNTRERLGPNDLLVVKTEPYDSKHEEKGSENDRWGSREVIGVICPAKSDKDVTEICMDDGTSRWEVTNMPNGGLEFNSTDDHGLAVKARWVLKPSQSRRVSGLSVSSQTSPTTGPNQDDKKYTFSTIDPNSRRHPIIATMTSTRIDIMDAYTIPSATSPPTPSMATFPNTPSATPASIDLNSFLENSNSQAPIQTNDALQRFIVVSSIWVSQQGNYTPQSSNQACSPQLETSSLFRSSNRSTSMSMIDSPRSASPASTLDENRRSFPRMLRSSTEKLPRCMSFTESSTPTVPNRSQSTSPVALTRPRRSNSLGNGHLHSMTGSMRKRYSLAFGDEAVPESEEEKQSKRSTEVMRIKELAVPCSLERISSEVDMPEQQSYPLATIPSAVVVPPSSDGPTPSMPLSSHPPLSPGSPDFEYAQKRQSTFSPVHTAGLWDSGVTERPGLRARPTSMFVLNEKKRKQEKRRERCRNKEENDKGVPHKHHDWHRLRSGLKGLFGKEKA